MKIDFIGPFKRFTHGNTYIYILVDNFLGNIYPHPTSDIDTNNVIILFDYYLRSNPESYAVYIDASSYFTSQKLHTYFQMGDIVVVFALYVSYNSFGMIKKSNNILQQASKKMHKPEKE